MSQITPQNKRTKIQRIQFTIPPYISDVACSIAAKTDKRTDRAIAFSMKKTGDSLIGSASSEVKNVHLDGDNSFNFRRGGVAGCARGGGDSAQINSAAAPAEIRTLK